uniref:Uncharacterized protein n=1 Tax=Siphoviridae sp. ct3R43 TaxID=2825321 RepID=A0A8S5VG93_9CAUD|nr:MAG TPA: hypothetical protein [Siphoviridae sp. ct3R43]
MSLDTANLNLIYDRTESDETASAAIRKSYQALGNWSGLTDTERAQLERGALTYNTLNRVEAAVETLAAALTSAGYPVEVTPVLKGGKAEDREWQEGDIVRHAQWATYLDNVQRLRDAYYTLAETGELPAPGDKLKYTGANTIEKILADIDLLLDGMKSVYRRAGTFTAGGSYTRQLIRSI